MKYTFSNIYFLWQDFSTMVPQEVARDSPRDHDIGTLSFLQEFSETYKLFQGFLLGKGVEKGWSMVLLILIFGNRILTLYLTNRSSESSRRRSPPLVTWAVPGRDSGTAGSSLNTKQIWDVTHQFPLNQHY